MEEIKVGEYVRSLVNGEISKVLEVSNLLEEPNIKYYKTGKFTGFCSTEDYNVKHSSNIKDLIQAGDIVIYTINCKIADIDIVKEHTDARTLKKTLRVGLWSLEQVNIKQILTKEQFERKSYRWRSKSMKEVQKVLDELKGVRLEQLTGEAKRLFEAIMKIADERDELLEKNKEYEKQLDLDYVEDNYIHKNEIRKEIEELGNMKVSGDVFITSVNFAIKILQELLKDGGE